MARGSRFVSLTAVAFAVAVGCVALGACNEARHRAAHQAMRSSARATLLRIVAGAEAYYAEYGAFPRSVSATPAVGACCAGANKGKPCTPRSALWQHATWRALVFEISRPNYYSYEFVSPDPGSKAPASYVARARGDLDCDGVYATFEFFGVADATGNVKHSTLLQTRETE